MLWRAGCNVLRACIQNWTRDKQKANNEKAQKEAGVRATGGLEGVTMEPTNWTHSATMAMEQEVTNLANCIGAMSARSTRYELDWRSARRASSSVSDGGAPMFAAEDAKRRKAASWDSVAPFSVPPLEGPWNSLSVCTHTSSKSKRSLFWAHR